MIAIDDIKDEDSLRQWLTEWPAENGLDDDAARAIAVSISHRASMRVLPLYWSWAAEKNSSVANNSLLQTLRRSLLGRVSGKLQTRQAKQIASDLTDLRTLIPITDENADFISSAASFAGTVVEMLVANSANSSIEIATNSVAEVTTAFASVYYEDTLWSVVRTDCSVVSVNRPLWEIPLWPDREGPFLSNWLEFKESTQDPEWSFWIKWYDDALVGRAQNWKMLEAIALIDPEVWDAGAEAVAEEIARIEAEFDNLPDPVEPVSTTEQAFAANSRVIVLQLNTLKQFVEEEIQRLRGSNEISDIAMKRIALLEGLLDTIGKMQTALAGGITNSENALVVFEENLPKVFDTADEIAVNDDATKVSETIITMGASIAYLTERGTPGYAASGIAALVMLKSSLARWYGKLKSPKG